MKILDKNSGLRIQTQFDYITSNNIKPHATSHAIKMYSKVAKK